MSTKSDKAALRKTIAIKRVCKFANEDVFGYHVCPDCLRAYKYQPVLSPYTRHEYMIKAGITWICPNCASRKES